MKYVTELIHTTFVVIASSANCRETEIHIEIII